MTPAPLVTGVTGFVGREVARRLLAAGRTVVALSRSRAGVAAADRVAAALGVEAGDRRVAVVEGDLSAPDCGLADAAWRRLAASIETVIHCAGETAFAPHPLGPFEAVHVHGPRRLLQGLAAGRLRRWVHVSTAYVCGTRGGLVLESGADRGQDFHNVYERVKLASELALRAAGAQASVDVRVARPSVVVGAAPPTAGGAPSRLFRDFVRTLADLADLAGGRRLALRIEATPDAPFNLVPVDYVGAALVHLAGCADGAGSTVHLVARQAPTQAAVLATLTERLGLRGLRLVERLEGATPLERRVAGMLRGYRRYLVQHVAFDDTNARRLLPAAIASMAALGATEIHALVDRALATAGTPAT